MIITYLKLFCTFAKIGMFTIGGGYAMIPLIEREIVKRKWMSKEEFMEMFALTQSLPGVFAVNISISWDINFIRSAEVWFVRWRLFSLHSSL